MRIDVVSAAPQVAMAQSVSAAQAQAAAQAAAAAVAEEVASVAAPQTLQMQPQVNMHQIQAAEVDNEPYLSPDEIEKLVSRGNSLFEDLHLHEQFRLVQHDKLPRTMIRLLDVQQDRVLREFPPKKYLDLVAALQELSGLLFDERV